MSPTEILTLARTQDIALAVQGDRLIVDAPAGVLTPELRGELVRHKAALVVLLTPVTEFVSLKGGLVLPLPAVLFALDLERRGFRLSLDADEHIIIDPMAALTEIDVIAIDRWHLHVAALLSYECPPGELPQ